ncbi:MAG: hydantoinase/oxoprolinase family protein [Armatimonadota bacterium]
MMRRVGIDVGGTFTDLVAVDEHGRFHHAKRPSTPGAPSEALRAVLTDLGDIGRRLDVAILGTTVATNAVIERKGARVCFLTTEGFEHVPFIQRINKQELYNLNWVKPEPLIHRRDCLGVRERVDAAGRPIRPLDPRQLTGVVDEVGRRVRSGECQAVAISFLFSYLNPEHEAELERRLAALLPDLPVSRSSAVCPMWREFERGSTTIADAYVRPAVQTYVHDVLEVFSQRTPAVNLMTSNGGSIPAQRAETRAVQLLLSGLAGGVIGGKFFALAAGEPNVFTLDMGGTSCDIGIIREGRHEDASEFEVEWGIPITLPCVKVKTIGAGGGSIVWVDRGGFLHAGPQSAGAAPGPVAYDTGGTEVTLTDSNLVLGRLDPDYFLGGRMRLHPSRAEEAVAALAARVGMPPVECAAAVVEIANENMASEIRLLAVEMGYDVRDFALVAFGGAGPLHACAVARLLGMPRVLVPPHPGLCSAFGALIADWRVDKVRTSLMRSGSIVPERVTSIIDEMTASALEELRAQGFQGRPVIYRAVDMRYAGQNYEREVPLPEGDITAASIDALCNQFAQLHDTHYGFHLSGEAVELINFRVTALGYPDPVEPQWDHASAPNEPLVGRQLFFRAVGWIDCQVFRRHWLAPGEEILGPALLEEEDSTILVPPGDHARVLPGGLIMITLGGQNHAGGA